MQCFCVSSLVRRNYVNGLRSAWALLDLEFYILAFFQGFVSIDLNG